MYFYVKLEFKKKLNRIEYILVCYFIIFVNDIKVMGYLFDDVFFLEMKLIIFFVDKWICSYFRGIFLLNIDFCFLYDILGFCFLFGWFVDNRMMIVDDNY